MVVVDEPNMEGWCHLTASTVEELHVFADKIGIHRCWFHNRRGKRRPHYDVRFGTSIKAVKAGAIRITRKDMITFLEQNYGI